MFIRASLFFKEQKGYRMENEKDPCFGCLSFHGCYSLRQEKKTKGCPCQECLVKTICTNECVVCKQFLYEAFEIDQHWLKSR